MAAPRVLWLALVSLYEETMVMVTGNLLWVALNLPILILLAALVLPFTPLGEASGPEWVLVVLAWLFFVLPSPAGTALAGLSAVTTGPDVPRLRVFWSALRSRWRLSLLCFAISLVVAVALSANVYFYAVLSTGWVRFVSILWLYGGLLWLSLHVYLQPLLVYVTEPRLFDLYRRATFLALGNPAFTFLVLLGMVALSTLAVVFLPVYVFVAGAYLSLIQAQALREIRRRHGDPTEADGEVRSL